MARSVGDRRTVLGLLGVFAAVTVLLALTGTWSLVAFLVADRRRELGLRQALGAGGHRLVRGIVHEGARAGVAGVAAGIVGGLFASRLLERILWETEPTEPAVYAAGALLLLAVVLLASWLPARRVLAVDPVEALRAE